MPIMQCQLGRKLVIEVSTEKTTGELGDEPKFGGEASPVTASEKPPQTETAEKAEICPSCAALNLRDGKCHKCGYVETLQDYGYELHKLQNKNFILTRKDDSEPLCTFSNLTSLSNKKAVQRWTDAPLAVIEKSFAVLSTEVSKKNNEKTDTTKDEEIKEFSEEITIKAWELLRDPGFFYKIGDAFEKGFMVEKINKPRFVLGEERNKRIVGPLLIGASKLGMTSLIRVIGEPGTAKDTMVRMWLKLLGIKYLERSYLSAAALRYSQNIQDVDLLYIPDTPKMQGETGRQMLFMRADDGGLISEYATRDNDTGEMTTKTVTLPIKGVVTTSNEIIAGAALASGMWTLTTNADLALTQKVKTEKLKLRAGNRDLLPEEELTVWNCAFRILLSQELPNKEILVEYAEELSKIIGSERSESRRDPDKLCDLIGLIAWIRRFQKPTDERGRADFADLYIALQIGKDAIRETMTELNEKEQKIMEAISTKATEAMGVTVREIAEATKIAYKTVYNIIDQSLLEKGYTTLEKEGNRNYYRCLRSRNKDVSFPFQLGRNDLTSDEVIAFTKGVISDFSTSRGESGVNFFVVDPITGANVSFVTEGGVLQGKISLSMSGGNGRSDQTATNQASKGEKGAEIVLPSEKGKEKVVNFYKRVKPAEPCNCGKYAVEYELTLNSGILARKCQNCFEEFRDRTVNAEWQEKQGDSP